MITEWSTIPEPFQPATFKNPSYVVDLQIQTPGDGIVMVTPDGTKQYRIFIDFDGAAGTEFVAPFSGIIPSAMLPVTPPFPVFGQVYGDLLILSPGSGIIMPMGLVSSKSRSYARLRLDNDGALDVDPNVPLNYWVLIPENSIAAAVDNFDNWVFTQDVVMATPGQGIIMPLRGVPSITRRIRLDSDGAILTE